MNPFMMLFPGMQNALPSILEETDKELEEIQNSG
jgi:hypothetical protein